MNIIPVSFNERHKLMLANVKKWLDKRQVAIDPNKHAELLTELRIAIATEDLSLDKKDYSMDLLDALRLSLEFIDYG